MLRMLLLTRLCLALQLKATEDPTATAASVSPLASVVNDISALLREDVVGNGELTNRSLALFGICTASDNSSGSILLDLAKEKISIAVLQPDAMHVSEKEEQGMLTLTFDLIQSPLLMTSPVLLLAFESPLTQRDLDATFSSQSLEPNTQTVCISGETRYILLTGKSSEGTIDQNWQISAEIKSRDIKQNLKDILIGEKSGVNINMTPLLLLAREVGTDTRCISGSSLASLQTSFFCELKNFLSAVLTQKHFMSPPLLLNSLPALPRLTLGLSSSETLLAELINSTASTVFTFTGWDSMLPVSHRELALSPALLEELRQRLEQTLVQITDIIRAENVAQGAKESLGRLRELSALQTKEHSTGGNQLRAFLLLKALQMVTQTYNAKRKLRVTRAWPSSSVRKSVCGVRALRVPLTHLLLAPPSANIKNCHGSCAFPLVNTKNHAVLLNSYIERTISVDERAPCCVPVAYESLEVVDVNEFGSFISIKPDMVVTECGCR